MWIVKYGIPTAQIAVARTSADVNTASPFGLSPRTSQKTTSRTVSNPAEGFCTSSDDDSSDDEGIPQGHEVEFSLDDDTPITTSAPHPPFPAPDFSLALEPI